MEINILNHQLKMIIHILKNKMVMGILIKITMVIHIKKNNMAFLTYKIKIGIPTKIKIILIHIKIMKINKIIMKIYKLIIIKKKISTN
jgi:hypothetical protein